MWRLIYPLRYFRLLNSEKRHIDLWPTLLLAGVIAMPFLLLPGASFFRSGGFLDKLITLTSALTGFYVAALVAAATFAHPDLDKTITVGGIALVRKGDDGKQIQELLTRREFATTIFGYLSFATLMFTLAAALFVTLGPVDLKPLRSLRWVGVIFERANLGYFRDVALVAFTLTISHIAVVTSLGLYYLMDRLYRRDPKVTTPKFKDEDKAA